MSSLAVRLAENLQVVRSRIASAARQAGRDPSDITLVGVSKYVDNEATAALAHAGCLDLGEARPQSLWEKGEALAHLEIHWHLIGHLQRNKVRRTLPLVALIHAGDSTRLLEEIDIEAAKIDRIVPVLLEINVSGDAAKHGFDPAAIAAELPRISEFKHVRVEGLMTMAGLEGGADRARHDFDALRELRDRLRADCPPGISLDALSMGMSGDFEAAILAGATHVRVGSALWEGIAE